MYFLIFYFCYLAPNILGGHSGPFSLHLSHQDSVWLKPLEIGGAGGAIYLHTWYYTTLLGQHRWAGLDIDACPIAPGK